MACYEDKMFPWVPREGQWDLEGWSGPRSRFQQRSPEQIQNLVDGDDAIDVKLNILNVKEYCIREDIINPTFLGEVRCF